MPAISAISQGRWSSPGWGWRPASIAASPPRGCGAASPPVESTTHFLPSVLVGLGIGRADPCFGATMALRRADARPDRRLRPLQGPSRRRPRDRRGGAPAQGASSRWRHSWSVGHLCREPTPRSSGVTSCAGRGRCARIVPSASLGSALTHPLPLALGLALASAAGRRRPVMASWRLSAASALRDAAGPRSSTADCGSPVGSLPLRDAPVARGLSCRHYAGREVYWRGQRYRVRRRRHARSTPMGTLAS